MVTVIQKYLRLLCTAEDNGSVITDRMGTANFDDYFEQIQKEATLIDLVTILQEYITSRIITLGL